MPTRDEYFDHNFVPGLITRMVLAQYKARPELGTDYEALQKVYLDAGCPDVAWMIEHLSSKEGQGIGGFGSRSIVPEGKTIETISPFDLRELYFYSRRLQIEPLQWFGYFAREIHTIPQSVLRIVNDLCAFFARIRRGDISLAPMELEELDRPLNQA